MVIKWCCIGFEANYNIAGQRGSAVLVDRDFQGTPQFTLQFRAVDKGNEQSVSSATAALQIPISLVVDVGMLYCPWCGGDLEKWYADLADTLYRPDLKIP